jgi:hypothetical protein
LKPISTVPFPFADKFHADECAEGLGLKFQREKRETSPCALSTNYGKTIFKLSLSLFSL